MFCASFEDYNGVIVTLMQQIKLNYLKKNKK